MVYPRDRLRLAVLALGVAVTWIASCEAVLGDLPAAVDPVTGASGGASAVSSATDGGRAAGGGGGTASSATSATAGGGMGGAASPASGPTASSTSSGSCCDCDGDGHAAKGPCGGDDCDDGDRFAFPGETAFYTAANATVGFDWNCDGIPERDPALDRTLDCAQVPPPCTTAGEGFLTPTPPACGQTGPWGTCAQQGILCIASVIEQAKPMACR